MEQIGIADKTTLGATGDAPAAGGSVMARLAEILTNRLTAVRAALLDAAISSRQPATGIKTKGKFTTTSTTLVQALSRTGKGCLAFHCITRGGGSGAVSLKITVDGTVVCWGKTGTSGTTHWVAMVPYIFMYAQDGTQQSLWQQTSSSGGYNLRLPYVSSLLVEVSTDNAATSVTFDYIIEEEGGA